MSGDSAYSWFNLAGAQIFGVRAVGTLELPLTSYATVD